MHIKINSTLSLTFRKFKTQLKNNNEAFGGRWRWDVKCMGWELGIETGTCKCMYHVEL